MNLEEVETDLKKRLVYPYNWGTRQTNDLDKLTTYIYNIQTFDELLNKLKNETDFIKNYAMNRWFNFKSAKAVEYMFSKNSAVTPYHNARDKLVDFSLFGINFDHKTSNFPKSFGYDIEYAIQNKDVLIRWLYLNQSQEGRKHLGNRLFLIMYDSIHGEHWKIKAELKHINEVVNSYILNFKEDNLLTLNVDASIARSDAIFVCV